jgi:hypothetical protein
MFLQLVLVRDSDSTHNQDWLRFHGRMSSTYYVQRCSVQAGCNMARQLMMGRSSSIDKYRIIVKFIYNSK